MSENTNGYNPQVPEEPRYGRRAADEPGYTPPQSTPGQPDPSNAQPGYGSANHGLGSSGQGNYGQGTYGPAGTPNGQPTYGYPGMRPAQPGSGYAPTQTQLPGRGLPITLIVIGLLLMFIVAPVVLVSGAALTAANSMVSGSVASDSRVIDVDNTGAALITVMPASQDTTCHLEQGGETVQLEAQDSGGSKVFSSDQVKPGQYDVVCENLPENATVVPMNGEAAMGIVKDFGKGALWSVIPGLLGLGLLIWGIVKLVKVNRRRREIQLQQFGY